MAEIPGGAGGGSTPFGLLDQFFNPPPVQPWHPPLSPPPPPDPSPPGQPTTGPSSRNPLTDPIAPWASVLPDASPGGTVQAAQAAAGGFPAVFIPVAGVTAEQIRAQGSGMGSPRSGGRSHKGIDIFAPEGTPVLAAVGGTVVRASDSGGLGGLRVWVRGDDGRAYYYAHLSSFDVQAGQRVQAGQVLGAVGKTGNAAGTSPHLHFSINGQVGSENPVADPWEVLTGGVTSPANQSFSPTVQSSTDTYSTEPVLGPNATDDEIRAYIKENFGAMSWAIDHDELGPLLLQAAREGWAPTRLDAAISDTDWWRTTEPSLRQWQATLAEDPAAAQAQIDQTLAELQDFVSSTGLQVGSDAMRRIAEQSIALGWTDVQLRDALSDEVDWVAASSQPTASFGEAVAQLRATAEGQYMVPMSEAAAAGWARRIFEGTANEEGFEQWLRDAAVSRFPQFAERLQQGVTPAQMFDSYRQMAAETLEIDPEQIDMLHDPKYSTALEVVEGEKMRPMTMSEWGRYLRELPEYRFTTQANRQGAEIARSLGQMFGFGT